MDDTIESLKKELVVKLDDGARGGGDVKDTIGRRVELIGGIS